MADILASRAVILKVLGIAVHAASVAGFIAVCSAVAVTAGPLDWAPWRRISLGWQFWMVLGSWGATLAVGSLLGCLILAAESRSSQAGKYRSILRYLWLNLATVFLSMFVPAIAAL